MTFKDFIQNIFSIKNVDYHKQITIFGIKIKIINNKYIKNCLSYSQKLEEWLSANTLYLIEKFFQSKLVENGTKYTEFIGNMFNSKNVALTIPYENWYSTFSNYQYLFNDSNVTITSRLPYDKRYDFVACFGTQLTDGNATTMYNNAQTNSKIVLLEPGFLTTIKYYSRGINEELLPPKYSALISFIFDDQGVFCDARKTNHIEKLLNDKNLIITEEQKLRARKCIDKIVENHLTKYNNQPIFAPKIGRDGVKKILVVDQSYADASIRHGLACDETFTEMLNDAVKNNPDCDIILKTHPDTKTGASGYYVNMESHNNIYVMRDPINPISLLKYVDEVYVCTSGLGLEALMCGKKVHVYGMPFYAGWGITDDKLKCERRTNKRTVEEIFYIFYIMYTHYVNPDKQCRCEIEEAMDYLLKLRDEYFNGKEIA